MNWNMRKLFGMVDNMKNKWCKSLKVSVRVKKIK
jgi:hypothetical protein